MQTIAYLKKTWGAMDQTNVREIQTDMLHMGIRVSYDWNKALAIYTSNKSTKNNFSIQSDYLAECNGLILDFGFNPIVVPKRNTFNCVDSNEVSQRLERGEYSVYEAHEGTIINLYFWDGLWRISSNRGIDIGNLVLEKSTWMELFTESLELERINPTSFFEVLQEDHCYTFGFTNPEIHPFVKELESNPYPYVWFVQKAMCDERGFTVRRLLPEWLAIPTQTLLMEKVSLQNLYQRTASAYSQYLAGEKPLYGYILEARDQSAEYDPFETVFMESDLMCIIRKLFYDQRLILMAREMKLQRTEIVDWYCFLDSSRTAYYLSLLPGRADKVSEMSDRLDNLVDAIVSGKSKNPAIRFVQNAIKKKLQINKNTSKDLIKKHLRMPNIAKSVIMYMQS